MAKVLRIVDVETQVEVSRATVDDNGQVSYSDDCAEGVVKQHARDNGTSAAEAVDALAADGWSNGYIMVALPGYPKTRH